MKTTPTDELRAIAEAASQGEWTKSKSGSKVTCGGWHIAGAVSPTNARHIATFDPPTVLALLDRLAALEAERAAGEARVVAWLIEFPEAGDRYEHGRRVGPAYPVGWLAGIPWGERWKSRTNDPNKAIRFARKEDAEVAMLIMQLAGTTAFASEHIWLDLSAALAKHEPGS